MDNPAESIFTGLGILRMIIAGAVGILLNSLLMWWVVGFLDKDETPTFRKSLFCAAALYGVSVLAFLCSMIPIPVVSLVIALVVWYKGSIAVIEGSFGLIRGALGILILYLIVTAAATTALNILLT